MSFARFTVVFFVLSGVGVQQAGAASERLVLLPAAASENTEAIDESTSVRAAAAAQLAELGVEIVAPPFTATSHESQLSHAIRASAAISPVAVVWLEFQPGSFVIHIYDPRSRKLYARSMERSPSAIATAEAVAIMLRSAVAALREGGPVDMAEVPVPESEPAPASAASPSVRIARPPARPGPVGIGVGYAGTWYSRDTSWQHGIALSVQVRPTRGPWFLGASYAHFGAITGDRGGVSLRIRRHPAELHGGIELRVASLWFTARGGLVADLLQRETRIVPEALESSPASHRWSWALSSRLGCALPLSPSLRLELGAGADFLLNGFDHVVAEPGGAQQTVFAPLRTRPRLELGLTWTL